MVGHSLESVRHVRWQAVSLASELRPIATAFEVAAKGWFPEAPDRGGAARGPPRTTGNQHPRNCGKGAQRTQRASQLTAEPTPRSSMGAPRPMAGHPLESAGHVPSQAVSLASELRPIATAIGVAAKGWFPEAPGLGAASRHPPRTTGNQHPRSYIERAPRTERASNPTA